ncbi:MAG: PIN domain nuclease [Actinomycetes bacterium]
MAVTIWLVDKSALIRMADCPEVDQWSSRIDRGLVRITSVTRLEVGYSARSGPELREGNARPPVSLMPIQYLTPAIEARALDVQQQLADRGQHRAPSVPDLLVAATAELCGLTVLHVDKDFELIAALTGQPVERLGLV